ncbi:hypothetical protein Rhe02_44210 [Rhizocola hellebori]|uniref:DUF1318 domain-containing protein n=1 Tax=Rhizocola hellebori TaxID=1392758 RepID=A0A8J3VGG9_9ACTN|nr:hypothetical protein [Rhizocola hellebori]GIH06354.1 hypothetical protein Rhe02_44210 [Rhizocola hellebori]
METTISARGRAVRLAATLIAGVLLLAGTLWGSDDHFPFGPFLMYAGVNPPNEPAPDPRIEGTTLDGVVIQLGEKQTGLRRAEVEGQQESFVKEPSRLQEVVDAYNRRNPQGPTLSEIRYVMREHEIKTSRPTGKWHDEILATWKVPR